MSLSFFALVGVLAIALLSPSYFFSKSQSDLAESKLMEFNTANPEIATSDLDASINDINSKLMLLSERTSTDVSEKVIGVILASRPKGITFNQILYNEKSAGVRTVEIYGTAADRTVLRNFKSVLDSNADFSKVNLPISNFIERSDINFTVSIMMK